MFAELFKQLGFSSEIALQYAQYIIIIDFYWKKRLKSFSWEFDETLTVCPKIILMLYKELLKLKIHIFCNNTLNMLKHRTHLELLNLNRTHFIGSFWENEDISI